MLANAEYIEVVCPICKKETEVLVGHDWDGDEDGVFSYIAVEETDRKEKDCGCDWHAEDHWDQIRERAIDEYRSY